MGALSLCGGASETVRLHTDARWQPPLRRLTPSTDSGGQGHSLALGRCAGELATLLSLSAPLRGERHLHPALEFGLCGKEPEHLRRGV